MPTQPTLSARPGPPSAAGPTGLHMLPIGGSRDSYMYVPPQYDPARPMPLLMLLHGAGGRAHDGLRMFLHLADEKGLMLLAPGSHASSWDIITQRAYGPDLDLAERALTHAFQHDAVDPSRIGIGGFSDGASYALTLGVANGELFTHILAFSPGFIAPVEAHGVPAIVISHGKHDRVLSIKACSRRLVELLRSAAYPLIYHEFDGGHEIPADQARFAIDCLTGQIKTR